MTRFVFLLFAISMFQFASTAQRLVPLVDAFYPLSELLQGPNGEVKDAVAHEGEIIFVGDFDQVNNYSANNIARWNGIGYTGFFELPAEAMPNCIISSPAGLVVGGRMNDVNHIVKLEGNAWVQMGSGFDDQVYGLLWFEESMYACGKFKYSGGTLCGGIARWNGTDWEPVGAGFDDSVFAMEIYDGELYAGGAFQNSGENTTQRLAKWNGEMWTEVSGGLDQMVIDLCANEETLYLSGRFEFSADSIITLNKLAGFDGESLFNLQANVNADLSHISLIDNQLVVSELQGIHNDVKIKTHILQGNSLELFSERIGIWKTLNYEGSIFVIGRARSVDYAYQNLHVGSFNKYMPESFQAKIVANNIAIDHLEPKPRLFSDPYMTQSDYHVLGENSPTTIYAAAPWFGALSGDQTLVATNETYMANQSNTNGYEFGPYSIYYDQEYVDRYFRIWEISQDMIDDHIANYSNTNYVVPEVLQNWPGNGRYEIGDPLHLAPFYDQDEDGRYEPSLGDYPIIKGDHAMLYFMTNDRTYEEQGNERPLTFACMLYYFDDTALMENSLFINYTIINHGNDLQDAKFGFWADFDIGNQNDDYVGSAPELNSFYGYNSDNNANDIDLDPFGQLPPAQGFTFLNQQLNKAAFYEYGTVITAAPQQPQDFYNLLSGNWINYTTWLEPNWGELDGIPIDHYYHDCPLEFPYGFNEYGVNNPPAERLGFGSSFIENFGEGERWCIDLALTTAHPNSSADDAHLQSVSNLKESISQIQQLYEELELGCGPTQHPLAADELPQTSTNLVLYPNPSQGIFQISGLLRKSTLRVFDQSGRLITHSHIQPSEQVNFGHLENGLYHLEIVQADGSLQTIKWLKG